MVINSRGQRNIRLNLVARAKKRGFCFTNRAFFKQEAVVIKGCGEGDRAHKEAGYQKQAYPSSNVRFKMVVVPSKDIHNTALSYGIKTIKSSIMKEPPSISIGAGGNCRPTVRVQAEAPPARSSGSSCHATCFLGRFADL